MKKIPDTMHFQGCEFYKNHIFEEGSIVPVYNVHNFNGLNQIVGYSKFINPEKKILYRGECKLHNSMRPSINHTIKSQVARDKANKRINNIIDRALTDERFCQFSKLSPECPVDKYVIEAIMQHYGINTHCIDAVDNHWIALWFGQNKFVKSRSTNKYCRYVPRIKEMFDYIGFNSLKEEELYQYIVLLAADYAECSRGITVSNDLISIDLRTALPSNFLRPHAQHGWILRKKAHEPTDTYDLSDSVIGILRIRIDNAKRWLGDGVSLSIENLFPSPIFYQGYEVLLSRDDLFDDGTNKIARYVY